MFLYKNENVLRYIKQQGAILPLVALMLSVILGLVAYAVDGSRVYLVRTQLQNALDMAALTSATVLDQTKNTGDDIEAMNSATIAARKSFEDILALDGNGVIKQMVQEDVELTIEFAQTLNPFVLDVGQPRFVRVGISKPLKLGSSFGVVFDVDYYEFDSTAVAGPSTIIPAPCNLTPMVLCEQPGATDGLWGYAETSPVNLAISAGDAGPIGAGNFSLIQPGAPGADEIKLAFAADGDNCGILNNTVQSQPGGIFNPMRFGINTRFGIYNPGWGGNVDYSALYPSDILTGFYSTYEEYQEALLDDATVKVNGKPGRRVMSVAVGTCTGDGNGSTSITVVGTMCLFLRQAVGLDPNDNTVSVDPIKNCVGNAGKPGEDTDATVGQYRIQLYDDPDRITS